MAAANKILLYLIASLFKLIIEEACCVLESAGLRVVQVSPRYYPYHGGVEEVVKEISERLSSRGHHVLVLTTDPTGRLPKHQTLNGVEVRRFWAAAPSDSYYLSPGLFEALRKETEGEGSRADILHAHSFHAFPAATAALMKGKSRLVVSPHYHGRGHSQTRERLFQVYKRTLLKALVRHADKILCVSEYERRLIEKDFPGTAEKTLLLPNGVNIEELKRIKRRPSEGLKILSVSRLERYKNLDKLVEALGILRKRGIDSKLTIVGRGPYKQRLKSLSESLGIAELIDWRENLLREDLYEEYSSSNVFVLLSSDEAFGIAAAEAMVIGLPTVLSDAAALSSYVEKDFALGVSLPLSPDRVADKIAEAVQREPLKADRVRRHFLSWEEVVDRLEKIYQDLRDEQP